MNIDIVPRLDFNNVKQCIATSIEKKSFSSSLSVSITVQSSSE
jgi:hypothetical protein